MSAFGRGAHWYPNSALPQTASAITGKLSQNEPFRHTLRLRRTEPAAPVRWHPRRTAGQELMPRLPSPARYLYRVGSPTWPGLPPCGLRSNQQHDFRYLARGPIWRRIIAGVHYGRAGYHSFLAGDLRSVPALGYARAHVRCGERKPRGGFAGPLRRWCGPTRSRCRPVGNPCIRFWRLSCHLAGERTPPLPRVIRVSQPDGEVPARRELSWPA